jgi:uncharacterized protein (UPF0335 family)
MTADKQLKSYIDRVLRLKEEQDALGQDIRDVYAEARAEGYDKTVMGKLVAHLRKVLKEGDGAIAEAESIFDTYLHAYQRASGMPVATHTHEEEFDPITGEFVDEPVNAKLVAKVATAMQTDIGRKALGAAVDIMIASEEAEEQNQPETANEVPAQDGKGTGLGESLSGKSNAARPASVDAQPNGRGSAGQAEESVVTVVGTESGTVANFETCERCQGNGEIVTDWDRYKHPNEDDVGDEAVAECPDCGGEGIIDLSPVRETPSIDSAETGILAEGTRSDANTGGRHVTAQKNSAASAGALVQVAPATKSLRPHCRNPGEHCGGYGSNHCHSCLRAAREPELEACT